MRRIENIYAFIGTDKDGSEGILSLRIKGELVPLIAMSQDLAREMAPLADKVIKQVKASSYELRYFKSQGDIAPSLYGKV